MAMFNSFLSVYPLLTHYYITNYCPPLKWIYQFFVGKSTIIIGFTIGFNIEPPALIIGLVAGPPVSVLAVSPESSDLKSQPLRRGTSPAGIKKLGR